MQLNVVRSIPYNHLETLQKNNKKIMNHLVKLPTFQT